LEKLEVRGLDVRFEPSGLVFVLALVCSLVALDLSRAPAPAVRGTSISARAAGCGAVGCVLRVPGGKRGTGWNWNVVLVAARLAWEDEYLRPAFPAAATRAVSGAIQL
jgi:hypothetical protein